jgi:hypothetical protein
MGFTDNPIINSPFDRSYFELDDEGQPTGKELPGRRESVQVVLVPKATTIRFLGTSIEISAPNGLDHGGSAVDPSRPSGRPPDPSSSSLFMAAKLCGARE